MRFVLATVLVLAVADSATAQRERGMLMGAGMGTCAEFALNYRQNPKDWEMFYFSWAQGFMSGHNIAQGILKRPPRDLNAWSISDQTARLRYFCQEKPLSLYADAVEDLWGALPRIPPQSN